MTKTYFFLKKKKLQYEYDQLINLVSGHEDETNNLNGSIKKLQRDLEANNTELTELRDRKDKNKIADLEQQVQDLEDRPVGTSNIDQTEVIKRDNQIAYLENEVAALKDQNTQLDAAKKNMKSGLSKTQTLNAQVSSLKVQVSAPASVAQEEEKNMLNARIAEIQAQLDEERQKADSADVARKVLREIITKSPVQLK
ncbi:hypothetical protein EIN_070710 [Entamoeba invadens IP1]|uniref:Uncharacterized protein n=1 Tax=Entamoeba invadens IP1 TaxID=370355 RepID=L7FK05_ENTIV|nr:hypothetical protein EIN_070710 [Entamoeba invadens IP1]ELP83792.1 hypothetical protein EIN_070710 [Entamoeba invadens IP1]|eukprot:XP_004183138.1 hypothetical protein EIN_070710 [Entamoeba invadens IP1]